MSDLLVTIGEIEQIVGIAYLLAVLLEERGRIHAVGNGAAKEGNPVEDHGRLVGLLEENLVGDIEDNREDDEDSKANHDLETSALAAELLDKRMACGVLEKTHGGGLKDDVCWGEDS